MYNNFPFLLYKDHTVRQLRCEKLPQLDGVAALFTDIAVMGDTLLTTQEPSNEILVFKLNF